MLPTSLSRDTLGIVADILLCRDRCIEGGRPEGLRLKMKRTRPDCRRQTPTFAVCHQTLLEESPVPRSKKGLPLPLLQSCCQRSRQLGVPTKNQRRRGERQPLRQ